MTQRNGDSFATSIPSRALDVWRRLYTRYSLEPGPPSIPPDVAKTIFPVTQADRLLQTSRVVQQLVVVSGTGAKNAFTVPAGQRWTWYAFYAARTAGDSTISRLDMTDEVNGLVMILDVITAAGEYAPGVFNTPLPLDEGDTINFTIGGGSTFNDWNANALIDVETMF